MEDELICYCGRWIRKSELKYKTEATNNISNKYLYSDNRWKWRFYIPDIIYWMPIPKFPKE